MYIYIYLYIYIYVYIYILPGNFLGEEGVNHLCKSGLAMELLSA